MPRFAYALPFLPDKGDTLRALAEDVPEHRATEHRAYLLDRGIFRERWWMQTGKGSPALRLTLWDCDDINRVTSTKDRVGTAHEKWLESEVLLHVHGQPAEGFRLPRPEVLSGTTTMATATAESQTMFALPIPEGGVLTVRQLMERIEHGDLAGVHRQFLADASIREEWIWLQEPVPGRPALLLIQWIGDDLDNAWERLTHVDDEYARVLDEALFRRLIGISPVQVASWEVEQLLVMHVRRSDAHSSSRRRLGQRLLRNVLGGRWPQVEGQLDPQIRVSHPDGTVQGAEPARALLAEMMMRSTSKPVVEDLLVGDGTLIALIRLDELIQPVLMVAPDNLVTEMRLLQTYLA